MLWRYYASYGVSLVIAKTPTNAPRVLRLCASSLGLSLNCEGSGRVLPHCPPGMFPPVFGSAEEHPFCPQHFA